MLAGATAGVAASPVAPGAPVAPLLVTTLLALPAIMALRPRPGRPGGTPWLALVLLAATCAGLAEGGARLAAIDRGAYHGVPGARIAVRGFVAAVPRRSRGLVRVRVNTDAGRLLIEAPEPVPDLPAGREVLATGVVRAAADWDATYLRRLGVRRVLSAGRIALTARRRGGPAAVTDGIRDRAEAALDRGVPEDESALLRGMVLGQDDRIGPATARDFKRSGLAHLLAVSGQNVVLLVLLAMPLLALAGLRLRGRLVCALVLIAVYVPVTGAGPSIQRAGAMGAAALVAALAGRPRSRWYAMLLAALVTLAANPRATGDVGWQLSFAAVAGILLWAAAIRDLLLRRLGVGALRRALAEGTAMTIAATLATAPLMAHHFEAVSVASLPANLLALPAVAPVMWLGMLAAMAGQLPAIPVEPVNAIAALLVAYIAQIARWCAAPGWAAVSLRLPGIAAVAGAYCALAIAIPISLAALRRRPSRARPAPSRIRAGLALGLVAVAPAAAALAVPGGSHDARPPGLVVEVLDVGQGDSILLRPADGEPLLVDGGPPGTDLAERLRGEGVERLAAAILTHDQSDHAGGIESLLGVLPMRRLVHAGAGPGLLHRAAAAGVRTLRVGEGTDIRSGSLSVEVLWPPRELLGRDAAGGADPGSAPVAASDPNTRSLVLLARWQGFAMLLTGDAESEAVPIDPGPIDVLKVAHHGSRDAGLGPLLDRTAPGLAVISAGAGNPFGHPTPETLATLRAHGIPALRTDHGGSVEIDVRRGGWSVGDR